VIKNLNKFERKRHKEVIKSKLGWAYHDLLWFSEEEAQLAQQQRNELLEELSGWVSYSFHGSKPHYGAISPGCLICGDGGWGCNYINEQCTRHCFYCPQDRSIEGEGESETDGIIFKSPTEHVHFLKTFHIRGVAFSGGEPLLVLEKLLAHIATIRKEFGNSFYIWMYTNGDRLNRSTLKKLRAAGLNEIRIDLSARNYDLTPVLLSKEFIPTVTIEIPAIPEDFDLLKSLLKEMEKIGVDFLNLHQLHATKFNYKRFIKRNYHFYHQPSIPVFESELSALRLLLFARQQKVMLPINYCCSAYKNRFQGRDGRTRKALLGLKGYEEITTAGYIRSFRVLDCNKTIKSMVRLFADAHYSPELWHCNEKQNEIILHRDLLSFVDWSSANVTIRYFQPGVKLEDPEKGMIEGHLVTNNSLVYQGEDWSEIAIDTWRKLYIEKMTAEDAFRFFFHNYPFTGKDSIAKLQRETQELKDVSEWEDLESGMVEVY
jgi:uncharacterized protein